MKKIRKQTPYYTIFEDTFEGKVLIFRHWHESGDVDVFLDENIAKACGYSSKEDMITLNIGEQGKQEIITRFGYLPSWVRVLDDGSVNFVGELITTRNEA